MNSIDPPSPLHDFYLKPFPELPIDEKYHLIEQSLEHAQAFLEYYNNADVHQYIYTKVPTTLQEAIEEILYCRNLFYNQQGIYWTIATLDDHHMIGAVGLYIKPGCEQADISYDLNKKYWRLGITSKALRNVIRFAFEQIGINKLEAYTTKENIASNQLLSRLGFKHEGTLHNNCYFAGQYHDRELYSLETIKSHS